MLTQWIIIITAPEIEHSVEDKKSKDTSADGKILETTPADEKKTQHQEATHDENLTELVDTTDKQNKKAESIQGSKDSPFGLSDVSQQPTTTPVSSGGKPTKSRQRAQPTADRVTKKVLFTDLEKLHQSDEKDSELISYNPELSDIRGKPLSHW